MANKWRRLSKKEIDLIKIRTLNPLDVAERDFKALKAIQGKPIESPFIVGRFMYIATRTVEDEPDLKWPVWTYRVYRVPVKHVKTMVVRRVKEDC